MRRSRALVSLLALFSILLTVALPAAAEELRVEDLPRVAVQVDGKILDVDAYIINGRTVVPLRAIFEALGADVGWDGATRTVTGTRGSRVVTLTIDKTEAYVDGKPVVLAVPGMIINSRTFVPLRFISEAMDAAVSFDNATRTAIVQTDAGCTLVGGQKHQGAIKPGGETWGLCGSPHIISGTFYVAGDDNPVLTIEAGTTVQFEKGARLDVGANKPGGLLVKGTSGSPVLFTSALQPAAPGNWSGIHFGEQTLQQFTAIENANIEYGGATGIYGGAIYAAMGKGDLPLTLKNVQIKNSLAEGIRLWGGARLSSESSNISITGTAAADRDPGYPIVTGVVGLGSLPDSMTLTNNGANAIMIQGSGGNTIDRDTTVRNLKVPYVTDTSLKVEGDNSPTLTVEPGVIMLFPSLHGLLIGQDKPGSLLADATAGAIEAWNGRYKSLLDQGASLANGKSLGSGNEAWATNKAIVFGSINENPAKGSWVGVQFLRNSSSTSKMTGVVVNWAGGVRDDTAAVFADGQNAQVAIDKSMVMNSAQNGFRFWNNAEFTSFTGNYVTGNVTPIKLFANAAGSIGADNDFTGNAADWIDIIGSTPLTKSQTWLSHNVPYHLTSTVKVSGDAMPVLTIAPGASLLFSGSRGLEVGTDSTGAGSLVAVGTSDKPIVFTADLESPGNWYGISFGARVGKATRLEYAQIKYARDGITIRTDLGAFMKNLTISNSSGYGINRGYATTGTDFTKEPTIIFDGNAKTQR